MLLATSQRTIFLGSIAIISGSSTLLPSSTATLPKIRGSRVETYIFICISLKVSASTILVPKVLVPSVRVVLIRVKRIRG